MWSNRPLTWSTSTGPYSPSSAEPASADADATARAVAAISKLIANLRKDASMSFSGMSLSGVSSRTSRRPVDHHAVAGDDLVPLLSAARVTVVAGKGGVGKTTVTAVLATAAARAGMRVLAVELDGKPVLADLLGDIPHLALSAQMALEEYLRDHGFGRVAKRLSSSGVIDVVSTAAPGIDDIVVLGKIKQLERSGEWDAIIVDGPAAGHAVTMMTSASGLQNAVSGGPVRAQADDVLEMLRDPDRMQVALVTLPETTPVNETIETAFRLEDRVGVRLAPVIVNGVDVDPAAPTEPLSDLLAGIDVE